MTPATSKATQVLELGRKLLLSLGSVWFLFQIAPGSVAGNKRPETADERPMPLNTLSPPIPSPLLFDGIPMASKLHSVAHCHPDIWHPRDFHPWKETALLLYLDRTATEVTAAWLESPGTGIDLNTEESTKSFFHGAHLICDGSDRGRLTHTYTTATLDRESLTKSWGRPVANRSGPVPLLDDAVQVAKVGNLEWTFFLDEPAEPSTAMERLHLAMDARGWTAKTPTDEALREMGMLPPGAEGGIWLRGDALCLATRSEDEARDLLIIACRGNLKPRGGAR